MKKLIFFICLCISLQSFGQKAIKFHGGINFTKPKDNFGKYKRDMDIEGAVSISIANIKYSKNLSLIVEPIVKLKRYHMEAINLLITDYYISASDLGVRLYPFGKEQSGNVVNKIISFLYADFAYSTIKFVKVNIANDVTRTMASYGYGITVPLKDMSDLGFNSSIMFNAGVTQYRWTNSAGTKSSFAGKSINLIFAIALGGGKKK